MRGREGRFGKITIIIIIIIIIVVAMIIVIVVVVVVVVVIIIISITIMIIITLKQYIIIAINIKGWEARAERGSEGAREPADCEAIQRAQCMQRRIRDFKDTVYLFFESDTLFLEWLLYCV